MKAFYEQDANLDFLKNKTIAVIGYGSQGHAPKSGLLESSKYTRAQRLAISPSP